MKAANLLSIKHKFVPAAVLSVLMTVLVSASALYAQAPSQLTLADILIGLRSKKVTLPERNKILTEAVMTRGITFSLTAEIENELKTTGADQTLIDSIRKKSTVVKTSAVVNQPVENKSPAVVEPAPDFNYYMKRAKASSDKKDLDAALVDLGKAIEMRPDSFEAYFERGMAHLNKKALELAVADLSKAAELNPKSAVAFAFRGDAYERKGDVVKARSDYQTAVGLDSNIEPAKTNLAKIVAEEQRIAREAEEAKKIADAKKLAEVKKVVPELVELGQIYLSSAIRMVTPNYPPTALRAGISGLVKVEVVLDAEGNVTSAKAVEGHQFLKLAAEDAARRSKFKPAMFDGNAIKSKGYILYNFSPTGR